jgi:hypothetical protein
MKRGALTFFSVALFLTGTETAWGISFQCMVGLKDGTTEKVAIDADSEQRAKEMAVQKFGQRAWGMMSVGCAQSAPQAAAPGVSATPDDPRTAQIKQILQQNPQLSTVPGWPTSFPQYKSSLNIVPCPAGFWPPNPPVTNKHRCITAMVELDKPVYQTGPSNRQFMVVLYPETPRVWRVYDGVRDSSRSYNKLLAEFDMQGNRGVTTSAVPTSPPTQVQAATTIDARFLSKNNLYFPEYAKRIGITHPISHFSTNCLANGTIVQDPRDRAGHCSDYAAKDGSMWRVFFNIGFIEGLFKLEPRKDAAGNTVPILKEKWVSNGTNEPGSRTPTMNFAQELGFTPPGPIVVNVPGGSPQDNARAAELKRQELQRQLEKAFSSKPQ